jgi:hypothetical protein
MNKIHEPLQQVGDEIVILVNVLAHSTTLGYDNLSNLHLTSCNNKHVRSLKHLQELIIEIENDKEESEFIKFEFGGSTSSTSSTSESSTESSTGSDGVGGEDQNENKDCDGGGTIVVLETKSLYETTREVCDEHYIQKPYYFPPTLQLQSQSTSSTTITTTATTTATMPSSTIKQDDDEDVVVELSSTSETTTATNSATPTVAAVAAAATAITDDTKYSWEAELFKKSKPLVQAPPSISDSLEVLKRDGAVRLNSSKFFVDESLCSKLRIQILNEMNNKAPLSSSANNANGVNGDKKKKKERYVPGTRLRFDSSMDITFGGDVRHDMLLPIDFDSNEDNEDNDNEQHFPELRQVLESAA